VLTCGHAICDTCVQIFEQLMPGFEYHYCLCTCILCQSGFLKARLKPFTAGYQILSVDEEGPQGVISLKFMGLIQNLVSECSVQDLIDEA